MSDYDGAMWPPGADEALLPLPQAIPQAYSGPGANSSRRLGQWDYRDFDDTNFHDNPLKNAR